MSGPRDLLSIAEAIAAPAAMVPATAKAGAYDGTGEFFPPLRLMDLRSPDRLLSIRRRPSDRLLATLVGRPISGLLIRPMLLVDRSLAILADRRLSLGEV